LLDNKTQFEVLETYNWTRCSHHRIMTTHPLGLHRRSNSVRVKPSEPVDLRKGNPFEGADATLPELWLPDGEEE